MISLPPIRRPTRSPLGVLTVMPWLLFLLCAVASISGLAGWYDPSSWSQFRVEWGSPAIVVLIYALVSSLMLTAIYWVMELRAIDMISLWVAREALGFAGYFYLDRTAAYQPQSETGILGLAGLLTMISVVGFVSFFTTVFVTRKLTAAFHFPLRALPAPPDDLDRRLIVFLRFTAVYCVASTILPMVLNQNIPLLSEAGSQARLEFSNVSDTSRAFYNLSTALLPFVIGGLILSIVRRPLRILGWDGICIFLASVAQLLTSNRAPLMFGLGVAICLPTLAYRWPRWLLAFAFASYLFVIVFMGGFTSLLRTHPRSLLEPTWFSQSIEASYLGDNIIDLRDGSWVYANWDFRPLEGVTYLGGLASLLPSGLFPQKKQWHLGKMAVRMVGMPEDQHAGLRVTSFGESFLNFSWPGTIFLGTMLGAIVGVMRRQIEMARGERRSLWWGLRLLIGMQITLGFLNSGDAFSDWALAGFLVLIWVFVTYPARRKAEVARQGGRKKKEPQTLRMRPRAPRPPAPGQAGA